MINKITRKIKIENTLVEEEKYYDWKELLKEGNEYEEILKWSAKLKKHRPKN